ncbi:MAG: hypothetical protein CMC28_02415 [Flavobacteriaceae bacterium]|nr:hypothetical protein [Flavobacteriaceae bacterium]|tara:strand:- start:5892 stop:8414 length:2523 start_codon:yes stop_codon:yes gene_type:complete
MKNFNYLVFALLILFSFNINAQQNDDEVTAASRTAEKLNRASNSTTVISDEEINNKKTFNALGLLDNTVGVNISRQGVNSLNLHLREGVDIFSTQTLFLSDGRELNNFGLKFFDAAASTLSGLDIARVEVVRGSSGAVYGLNATSGVVSVTTKNPFDYPGTTVAISSGGINKNGNASILSGSESDVQSNWNLFSANLRHADHNEDKTFGYKINLSYSENTDWLVGDQTSQALGGQIPLMSSFNFDTSLYYNYEDYDLTLSFGTNETENIQRRQWWGDEKRDMQSTFFNAKLNSGDFFVQFSFTSNEAPAGGGNYNYWLGQDQTIESKQSHAQIGYDLALPKLATDVTLTADLRLTKFDSEGRVFGTYEDEDDFRTYGFSLQSSTSLTDNIGLLFQGRVDHFSVLNQNAFSPKGVIFIDDNSGGTLRLSMSQSHATDNAYTLFGDFAVNSWDGGYMGPYGNKNAITFTNPTWKPWPTFDALYGAHPSPYNGLGMDHFAMMNLFASQYIGAVAQQAMATGNMLLLLPFQNPAALLGDILAYNAYTPFYTHDGNGNRMDIMNADSSKLSTETTYELGYNNTLGKFSFSVDIYNIRKTNMVVAQQITPHVALDPVDAQTSMYTTMSNVLYSTYLNAGLPGSLAAQYAVLLGQIAGQFAAATAASIPSFGLVQADQSNGMSRLYWGSTNFGDINYWGSDIATSYEISDAASLFANYSFVNQTEFDKEDVSGGDETSPGIYHLNIPKHRVKAGFAYNPEKGMNFGISFRYQNSMNINTLNSTNSDLFWFDGFVPKRTVWDMNVGLPLSSKTRLDLTVDNVLGKKYQTMVNMPMVGQQALFTLTHNF